MLGLRKFLHCQKSRDTVIEIEKKEKKPQPVEGVDLLATPLKDQSMLAGNNNKGVKKGLRGIFYSFIFKCIGCIMRDD